MDSQRNFIIIALLLVSFLIWQIWKTDHVQQLTNQITNTTVDHMMNHEVTVNNLGNIITVQTDVLLLKINSNGGDIEHAFLLTYPQQLDSSQPFHLLETSQKFVYQAQSGLIIKSGQDNQSHRSRPIYMSNKDKYILEDHENELHVPLVYTSNEGVVYTKTFILKRNNFAIKVDYSIQNHSSNDIELILFGQLKQSINVPKTKDNNMSNFAIHNYRGAAYSTTKNKYKKYSFDEIQSDNLNIYTQGGWIAMLQQYFATSWVPLTNGQNTFYSTKLNNGQAAIGFKSNSLNIPQHGTGNLQAILWLGPKIQEQMADLAPNLDLTVDYGWLWFISKPLFKLLQFIQIYIGNWGLSIIIITFIVRGLMYPLTKAQYTSIAKMRILQPKLMAMRERLGEDKQRQSQEIIALYKAEKVNPLGGCLPLIIQMPIFLALYYMLSCSIELRHAPLALWIHDLSARDPYYILPIIMGMTMFLIQKISPNSITDPLHKTIMHFIPVMFTIFFLWFPSGLVLYYIISNLVTIIQQQLIYRGLEKRGLHN